jgi:hypothetical protein
MQNLKIINMEDVEREYVSWLMKPYIPFGKITIVQGDPGEGKTTVMLAIAADLTRGRELPCGSRIEAADVIFQTAEDGLADTIKPRLEDLGADCSRVHVIDESEKPLSFSDERIEQAIVKTNAKLLILDPAQAYFQGSSMNSADGVRPMMKILAGVAERTDCTIVIIGHLNKGKGKSQYRGLGSIDIYAAARSVLVVGRVGEYTRAIVQDKSNLAPPGKSLAFELDPILGFKWCGECDATVDDVMRKKSQRETQNDKATRIILEALGTGDEVAANELYAEAREEGISSKTLKRVKSDLGVISTKRGDAWYWRLPIEAKFTETQQGQEGQTTEMTSLTLLNSEQEVA